MVIGELPGKRGKQEERQDEESLRDGTELKLLRRIRVELVGDEQDDGLLEQAIVERPEELGRKKRKEPPRTEQMTDVLDQGRRVSGRMGLERPA